MYIEYSEKDKNQGKEKFYFSSYLFEFFSMISSFLASSCCIIQLFLNIFSIGCAGFAIFDKYEFHFLIMTSSFLCILIKLKGIRKTYKIILLCIAISISKRIVNLFLKDYNIESNAFLTVKGVKCNGCALKLCSELNKIAKRCSVEYLNPPIADFTLEIENNINENSIRNIISSVSLSYRILNMKLNNSMK